MKTYDFRKIEPKWQKIWEDQKTFKAPNPGDNDFDADKPKYYILDMFPYPSGKGLHVGHPLGYIATDVYARYKRMRGYNVLHPMGFDAFGLPAEQYAVETGTHPAVTTEKNISNMRRQLKMCALSYDWDRELSTTDEDYYKWTQWIFLKLFNSYFDETTQTAKPIDQLIERAKSGEYKQELNGVSYDQLSDHQKSDFLNKYRLAFLEEVPVNWCPDLGTVLANEEVTNDGRSERGNFPVYKRPLKQWMMRITSFADRLVDDLKLVEWPESVKGMQTNWVGKSEGAQIKFQIENHDDCSIEVFTTRPDTLMGATFLVLAADHPLVERITYEPYLANVQKFSQALVSKSDVDRAAQSDNKLGAFTGAYALHPITGKKIPIWIGDYVLMGYGTGAIMAVPAHDQRDFDFATRYKLDIVQVVREEKNDKSMPTLTKALEFEGFAVNSDFEDLKINGLPTSQAKSVMIAYLEKRELCVRKIQYKLRDWLFSRQRYWGEPFPILHGEHGDIIGLSEDELPVKLPEIEDFKPRTGQGQTEPEALLGRASENWKYITQHGQLLKRELNTMPQWAGSCWYYLRFLSPHFQNKFVEPQAEKYWMGQNGVDLYVGGVEHAVLHLLYARFWHKVLYDLNYVSTPEPFGRLYNQGYIQAYSYQDSRGIYVDAEQVKESSPGHFEFQGKPVTRNLGKMGKSLKNSIAPDEVIEKYGCDTFRLYEMYLGPVDQSKIWDTEAIVGVHRFLQKLWRNLIDENSGQSNLTSDAPASEMLQKLHETLYIVGSYMEDLRFNAAIAQLMIFNNYLSGLNAIPKDLVKPMLLVLNPLAPHIAEELNQELQLSESPLAYQAWPIADDTLRKKDAIEVVFQVNGKKRGTVKVAYGSGQEEVVKQVHLDEQLSRYLKNQAILKTIYVPGRLINFVVRDKAD